MRSQTPEPAVELIPRDPNTMVDTNDAKSRAKPPPKLQRPKKDGVKKKRKRTKILKPRRPNPHPPPPSINETILDSMKEVSQCPEIPEADRTQIRQFMQCTGEFVGWLNYYQNVELDLEDPNYERLFEVRERKRENICQQFEKANGWLNERIDFRDGEDAEQSDRVYVTSTKCERLNEMLTEFVNDVSNRTEDGQFVSIRSGRLRTMIHQLTDEERELLGPASEVETDEFVMLLAREVRDEIRKVLFDRWQEAALPNGQTSPLHDETDTNGVFSEKNHEDLKAKRQETIKSLAEHAKHDGLEAVDEIMENMFDVDESEYEDDMDEYDLEEVPPEIVTIDDVESDEEADLLPAVPAETVDGTDDEIIWLDDEDDPDILEISPPTTPSARPPPASLKPGVERLN